jgi:hypothetical protein
MRCQQLGVHDNRYTKSAERYMLEALERKLAHGQRRAPDLSDAERESRAGARERRNPPKRRPQAPRQGVT